MFAHSRTQTPSQGIPAEPVTLSWWRVWVCVSNYSNAHLADSQPDLLHCSTEKRQRHHQQQQSSGKLDLTSVLSHRHPNWRVICSWTYLGNLEVFIIFFPPFLAVEQMSRHNIKQIIPASTAVKRARRHKNHYPLSNKAEKRLLSLLLLRLLLLS